MFFLKNCFSFSCCVCVSTIAGQEDCWLLTETLVQSVSLQLKVCLNLQCLALHSFTDLHPGKPQGLIRIWPFNKYTLSCVFNTISGFDHVVMLIYNKIPPRQT